MIARVVAEARPIIWPVLGFLGTSAAAVLLFGLVGRG